MSKQNLTGQKINELKKGYQRCPNFSAGFANKQKVLAQGTIEYLVIIGVVVVISLVVVGLLVEFMNTSSITDATTNIQTQLGTSGLGINEAIADISGEGIIDFRNNTGDNITITKITTTTGENHYQARLATGATNSIALEKITQACNCTIGQAKTNCEIEIYYTTRHGLEKKATQTLNIECTNTVTPTNPQILTQPTYVFLNDDCYDDQQDPIPICTIDDLDNIRNNLSGNYKLMADIDASGTSTSNSGAGWIPLGTLASGFTGIFDGNGRKIVNLHIYRPSTGYIGLFGHLGVNDYISTTGTIQKIGLIDANIRGKDQTGGIVGFNNGTIQQVYTTGNITGGSSVGGIIGYNNMGILENSYNLGTISGGWATGGVTGRMELMPITNTFNSGSVSGTTNDTGGIVGWIEMSTLNKSFNVGNVNGSNKYGAVGGTGMMMGEYSINTLYWDTYLTGQNNCFYDGDYIADSNTNCTSTNNQLSRYYSEIPNTLGWSTSIWTITENALPKLSWE